MNITAQDIRMLILQGEGVSLEMKECKDSVPRSVWETYSSFANTRGGIILLGIKEHKYLPLDSRFEIVGVSDSFKVVTDFFNILNNRQKVSRSILIDSDVRVIDVDGKDIIYINVPEADYHKKPIYINDDLQDGTFKRTHEGDRHVDMEELSMLLRDSSDDIDSQIVDHYTLDDIDVETLRKYRLMFNEHNPDHSYIELADRDFLSKMGAYAVDRHNDKEGLTRAGLLMFGKGQSIHEVFKTFRVDYLDLIGIEPGSSLKWNDRLTDDGRWEDNIYNFVTLTMRKLLFSVPSEGRLSGTVRIDGGPLHEGIREALINSATYCDYMLNGVLRIDRRNDCIILRNPGLLRIDAERIYDGDFTHARNRTIQKLFRMIGFGDNIGSGFQKILSAWEKLGYPRPELKELDDVKEVWLTLPLSKNFYDNSRISSRINSRINSQINSEYNSIGVSEVTLYNGYISQSNSQSNSQIISRINSHVGLSKIQRDILIYMLENPKSSIRDTALALNIKQETIRYQRRLMDDIVRTEKTGSNKSGLWKITFLD